MDARGGVHLHPSLNTPPGFDWRYRITRDGDVIGWAAAEWHGAAIWSIDAPDFADPGEPRTIERLDAALYAAGYELVPDE
jgi:hypothetical protein